MKKPFASIITTTIIVGLIIFTINRKAKKPVEVTFLYFDTFIKLQFYPDKSLDVKKIKESVNRELQRIDSLYGYGENSITCKLSKESGEMKITSEEYFILRKSIAVSKTTDGAFDITVGELENIWSFKQENPHIPIKQEIGDALSKTGYKSIILTDTSISLWIKDMIIDLGGVSKGYALDRVVEILKNSGVSSGIVDAGGDLKIFGNKPDGTKWLIGIRNPKRPGSIIKKFYINKGAVSTSGNYERFFIRDGKRYHHILDPYTGYPADGCVSVTVLTDEAIMSDALATGIFVLGPKKGMALIERLKNVEGLIMYEENDSLKTIKSTGIELKK